MPPSLEDRFAVQDLFVRYTAALDDGDAEGIAACFTEDGTLESASVGLHHGRENIRAFSARFSDMRARGAQMRHVISNLTMTITGETGRAVCYLTNILTMNGTARLMPPGRYECQLRKIEGAWLFQHRLVVLDAPFVLPAA